MECSKFTQDGRSQLDGRHLKPPKNQGFIRRKSHTGGAVKDINVHHGNNLHMWGYAHYTRW